jgi:hypothetical protein
MGRGHVRGCSMRGGRLEVLQWLRGAGCPWGAGLCASAAYFGHVHILTWARGEGCPCDERTCETAAGRGHIELLAWARGAGCPWNRERCRKQAYASMHYAVVEWIDGQPD